MNESSVNSTGKKARLCVVKFPNSTTITRVSQLDLDIVSSQSASLGPVQRCPDF